MLVRFRCVIFESFQKAIAFIQLYLSITSKRYNRSERSIIEAFRFNVKNGLSFLILLRIINDDLTR